MAEIVNDTKQRPELRGRIAAELAQYLYPKLRALEHSGVIDLEASGQVEHHILVEYVDAPPKAPASAPRTA